MFTEFIVSSIILSIILFCTDHFYYNNDTGSSIIKSIIFILASIGLAYLISYLYGMPPNVSIKKKTDKNKDDDSLKGANQNVINALEKSLKQAGHQIAGNTSGTKDFMTSMFSFLSKEDP